MKKIFLLLIITGFITFGCKQSSKKNKETITKGIVHVYVDETLLPIIEEQKDVFENNYKNADIELIAKPETDLINGYLLANYRLIIIPRKLEKDELLQLKKKNHVGKATLLATDAIAVINNKQDELSKISTQEIYKILQGKSSSKQLVFDNSNSSTLTYLMKKAGVKKLPNSGVTALKNCNEVITFVSENKNNIGFVGVNWMLNTSAETENAVNNVKVLSVGNTIEKAVKPTQSAIATGEYPFTRNVYMLNYYGTPGLGMGFASFIAGDVGQRIILKSGLLPYKIPTRELRIRKEL